MKFYRLVHFGGLELVVSGNIENFEVSLLGFQAWLSAYGVVIRNSQAIEIIFICKYSEKKKKALSADKNV